jgi:exodeoxyribonuclease-3
MKLMTWNVNGIRAIVNKGFFEFFEQAQPNVLCLQETKASVEQLPKNIIEYKNYISFWSSAKNKKGYSGTAVYTNIQPIKIEEINNNPILRNEGRVICLEFQDFFLFNVYFPNGGMGENRLKYKLEFYDEFLRIIQSYEKIKPVIFCGDVNTAHKEIDLARPKENINVSGFMPIEREWIDRVIDAGFIDCFRKFNSNGGNYTWWDLKSRARERNVGWRIDYFFASKSLDKYIINCYHLTNQMGSDHCPVVLEIGINYSVREISYSSPNNININADNIGLF